MVFSSTVFLWVFLPIVFFMNLGLSQVHTKLSNLFLLIASLFFYAWGEPILVILMMSAILINWLAGIGMARFPGYSRWILAAAVLIDLGMLGYYKYAGLIVRTINMVCRREILADPMIVLPIGISFFTFQAISYAVDVYRGDVEAQPDLIGTALYISFFPQLIAGPIVKYREIHEQIACRQITAEGTAQGIRRFLYGLGKKVLIANTLGLCADTIYQYPVAGISGFMAWMAALTYTFQIYYDFSGYSDMAIGLGGMFGFHIPENFNYPYLSRSIGEFWRRWHISLGSWFREYVYIPLGGNRDGKKKTCRNLGIVFILTGLWHGANYSFILWGIYHGFLSIAERTGLAKWLEKHPMIGWLYTSLAVVFGWVLFRAESILHALKLIKRMLLPWAYTESFAPAWRYLDARTWTILICAAFGAGALQILVPDKIKKTWKNSFPEAIWCAVVLVLCLASVASDTYNPFIYFQF